MIDSTPPLMPTPPETHLFYYRNASSRIQIIRIAQTTPPRFEKIVFPGEQLLFAAAPTAFLEICTGMTAELTLVHQIPCSQLRVIETGDQPFNALAGIAAQ
ncbi:MAG TPA: DUF1830 domain-containing protein [Allocoleopsis sp.]